LPEREQDDMQFIGSLLGFRGHFRCALIAAAGAYFVFGMGYAVAQPQVSDYSYVTSQYGDGAIQVQFAVWVAPPPNPQDGYSVNIQGGYIPGVTLPAYIDCNCTAHSEGPPDPVVTGYWSFAASNEAQDGQDWYFDLSWVVYAPTYSFTACSGCVSCNNAQSASVFLEYYTTVEDDGFEVVIY
jgi:hypothetical protein